MLRHWLTGMGCLHEEITPAEAQAWLTVYHHTTHVQQRTHPSHTNINRHHQNPRYMRNAQRLLQRKKGVTALVTPQGDIVEPRRIE
eukprot:6866520-Prorocentrum_lima.AAC.1